MAWDDLTQDAGGLGTHGGSVYTRVVLTRRRAATVVANAIATLAPQLAGVALSLMVVRSWSADLWGEYARVAIVAGLAAHLLGWGNKDYLLTRFAASGARVVDLWRTNLATRLCLAVVLVPLTAWVASDTAPVAIVAGGSAWALAQVWVQSHESLVLYRKDFRFMASVQLLGVLLPVGVVMMGSPDLTHLVAATAVAGMARGCALAVRHGTGFRVAGWGVDWSMLQGALPFMLIGFSGLLSSRVDLYCIALFSDATTTAVYQVFSNYLLQLQALSALAVMPFVKAVIRLRQGSAQKMGRWLGLMGVAVVAVGMPVGWALLEFAYGFQITLRTVLLGAAAVLPCYWYATSAYRLYGLGRAGFVAVSNFASVGVNAALNLWWVPGYGIDGAVAATAMAQGLLLVLWVGSARGEEIG